MSDPWKARTIVLIVVMIITAIVVTLLYFFWWKKRTPSPQPNPTPGTSGLPGGATAGTITTQFFSCQKNVCTPDPNGTFPTASCGAGCQGQVKYLCDVNKGCIETSGIGYTSLANCQSDCAGRGNGPCWTCPTSGGTNQVCTQTTGACIVGQDICNNLCGYIPPAAGNVLPSGNYSIKLPDSTGKSNYLTLNTSDGTVSLSSSPTVWHFDSSQKTISSNGYYLTVVTILKQYPIEVQVTNNSNDPSIKGWLLINQNGGQVTWNQGVEGNNCLSGKLYQLGLSQIIRLQGCADPSTTNLALTASS